MAFQSLNIIGSFTAGTNAVQGQAQADRQRIEAYRSLLKDQVAGRRPDGKADDPIEIASLEDRITIGDAPEERRPPYQSPSSPGVKRRSGEPDPSESEQAGRAASEASPDRIDVIV